MMRIIASLMLLTGLSVATVAAANEPENPPYRMPSTMTGAEIDGSFDLTPWLQVGGAFTYTHARYTDPQAVVEALAATEMAVQTAVAVRDKVVEAYQEILRMPV